MYLLPEFDDEPHAWRLLEHGYDAIFNAELDAWHRVQEKWPHNRSFAMFQDWFDVTFVSLIEDLCDGGIVDSDATA